MGASDKGEQPLLVFALVGRKATLREYPSAVRFHWYDPEKDIFCILGDEIRLGKLEQSLKQVWQGAVSVYRQILRYEAWLNLKHPHPLSPEIFASSGLAPR